MCARLLFPSLACSALCTHYHSWTLSRTYINTLVISHLQSTSKVTTWNLYLQYTSDPSPTLIKHIISHILLTVQCRFCMHYSSGRHLFFSTADQVQILHLSWKKVSPFSTAQSSPAPQTRVLPRRGSGVHWRGSGVHWRGSGVHWRGSGEQTRSRKSRGTVPLNPVIHSSWPTGPAKSWQVSRLLVLPSRTEIIRDFAFKIKANSQELHEK
jgi:hypothetical protein